MTTDRALVLGAVAYDPRVVTIWEGFAAYLRGRGVPVDYVLFSNYERQVDALMSGTIDLGWNSPLAWIRATRMAEAQGTTVSALAMRDTDRNLTSVIVVREDSPVVDLEELAGRVVAVGAPDSPQATLIPLAHLRALGLAPGADFSVVYQDLLPGKHGDHGAAERLAARVVVAGEADAACVLGGNHILFAAEGVVPAGALRVVGETGRFDHCNFTVGPAAPTGLAESFRRELLAMPYHDPVLRPLFELEGLRSWVDGRSDGYGLLERAVDEFGIYDSEGNVTLASLRG